MTSAEEAERHSLHVIALFASSTACVATLAHSSFYVAVFPREITSGEMIPATLAGVFAVTTAT